MSQNQSKQPRTQLARRTTPVWNLCAGIGFSADDSTTSQAGTCRAARCSIATISFGTLASGERAGRSLGSKQETTATSFLCTITVSIFWQMQTRNIFDFLTCLCLYKRKLHTFLHKKLACLSASSKVKFS